jgi:hypothetical protein
VWFLWLKVNCGNPASRNTANAQNDVTGAPGTRKQLWFQAEQVLSFVLPGKLTSPVNKLVGIQRWEYQPTGH